jgi:hypothetical protein
VLTLFVAIGAFNLVTDVILLTMPLPVVVRMHTNWKRKGMFCAPENRSRSLHTHIYYFFTPI